MNSEFFNIYCSLTGYLLVSSVLLPLPRIEELSGQTAEGHFRADSIPVLVDLGEALVYALPV
jgi:hypothetical protein